MIEYSAEILVETGATFLSLEERTTFDETEVKVHGKSCVIVFPSVLLQSINLVLQNDKNKRCESTLV